MAHSGSNSNSILPTAGTREPVYWRVEGSLLELGAMRPVGFFTWNSQSFSERWARRAGMAGMALTRPFSFAANPTFPTRFLHQLLRGRRPDRPCPLGREEFPLCFKTSTAPA